MVECARDRNHQLKENVKQGKAQLERFRQLTEGYSVAVGVEK